jgi:hypothetical protein
VATLLLRRQLLQQVVDQNQPAVAATLASAKVVVATSQVFCRPLPSASASFNIMKATRTGGNGNTIVEELEVGHFCT